MAIFLSIISVAISSFVFAIVNPDELGPGFKVLWMFGVFMIALFVCLVGFYAYMEHWL